MLRVVHALLRERVVVPNRQVADRDHDGVEDEGDDRVAEEPGDARAQRLGDDDVRRARGGAEGQPQGRGDGEQRGGHHDQDQVLDHVVPEQLAVVDADEAEDPDARGEQRADPGDRLADRPRMARVQGVVAAHAPQVEAERDHDHRHRDEIELRGEELRAPQGGESRVGEDGDHHKTVPPRSAVLPNALLHRPGAVAARPRSRRSSSSAAEVPAQGARVLLGLLPVLGPGDGHRPLGDEPGQRHLAGGAVAVGGPDAAEQRRRSCPPRPWGGPRTTGPWAAGWPPSTCRSGVPARSASRPGGRRRARGRCR